MRARLTALRRVTPQETGSQRRSLVWAVLVGLALRLIVVAFLYTEQLGPRLDHWSFGYEIGKVAHSIASGHGFGNPLPMYTGPTAMLTPVYPYLVAATFELLGIYSKASAIVLLSLNSLFSALTCVPIYFIAQRSFGRRTANTAAWIWVFFPYAILLSASMIWETCLTTFLLCLLFWWALHMEESTGLGAWMGWGLLYGITALANPAVLILLPFLLGWICFRRSRDRRAWAVPALASMLAVIVVLLPWEVRNQQTFGRFVPLRDNFWLEMWIGNNGDTSFWSHQTPHPIWNADEARELVTLGEIRYMEQKRREALTFIKGHPKWFVIQTLRRFTYTWTGFWSLPQHRIWEQFDPEEAFDPAHIAFCTALTGLALYGLYRAFMEHSQVRWIYATVLASFPSIYYFTRPHIRYRHPIDPLITILVAYACSQWRNGRHGRAEDQRYDVGHFEMKGVGADRISEQKSMG